jgi:hypothetical protein
MIKKRLQQVIKEVEREARVEPQQRDIDTLQERKLMPLITELMCDVEFLRDLVSGVKGGLPTGVAESVKSVGVRLLDTLASIGALSMLSCDPGLRKEGAAEDFSRYAIGEACRHVVAVWPEISSRLFTEAGDEDGGFWRDKDIHADYNTGRKMYRKRLSSRDEVISPLFTAASASWVGRWFQEMSDPEFAHLTDEEERTPPAPAVLDKLVSGDEEVITVERTICAPGEAHKKVKAVMVFRGDSATFQVLSASGDSVLYESTVMGATAAMGSQIYTDLCTSVAVDLASGKYPVAKPEEPPTSEGVPGMIEEEPPPARVEPPCPLD